VTTFDRETVKVDWTAPFDQGSPITAYRIYIRESDLSTYSLELVSCDGSTTELIDATDCSIPVSILSNEPFNLPWGANVHATVFATNLYGDSIESEVGNGALMITYPDAPINLAEDLTQRTASTIGLQWDEGLENGGSTITNYILSQKAEGESSFTVISSDITLTSVTVEGLTFGLTYIFKVQSQNDFDLSDYSSELTLLCATMPLVPSAPSTTTLNANVIVDWTASSDQGTPITAYKVYLRQSDLVYTLELTSCNGGDNTIISATLCTIPLSTLRASPFNLVQGNSVFAKVIATNLYGDSLLSSAGNGALVQVVPNAPSSLANNAAVTTRSKIGITWTVVNNGGSTIIDYRISYD
jgi:hypothetical protein